MYKYFLYVCLFMNNIYEYVLMAGITTTFIFVYFLSIRSLKGTGSELVFGPWCSGTDRMQRTSGRWSWASWKPESGEHVGFQTWRKCEATRPRRSRGTHTAVSCSPGLSYVTQVFWGQISVLRAGDTSWPSSASCPAPVEPEAGPFMPAGPWWFCCDADVERSHALVVWLRL